MLAPSARLAPRPQRVLVAGSSGVGKTELAHRIQEAAGLPPTEIDGLFHGPGWTVRPGFVAAVETFTQAQLWTTEWQYASQLGDLLVSRADTVVLLDYSIRVHMTRLVGRTVRRRIQRTELWSGNVEPPLHTILTNPDHIIRWGWKGRAKYRARAIAAERSWPRLRVVLLRSQKDADEWLRNLADAR